jgi:hypothetical protein
LNAIETPMRRWYFGWNIVAAASLVTLLTVGMRMGIGPFFLPLVEDLGFSRSLLSGIVAIGMLVYGRRSSLPWPTPRRSVRACARRREPDE